MGLSSLKYVGPLREDSLLSLTTESLRALITHLIKPERAKG